MTPSIKDVFKNKASEIKSAKEKFLRLVKNGKLYHATDTSKASTIEKSGLRAPVYLSFNDISWEGEAIFIVDGKDVPEIYPDPEHLLDGGYFDELNLPQISFETVTKHVNPDALYWMYFDLIKQEGWEDDKIISGFWLVSPKAIAKEKLSREK